MLSLYTHIPFCASKCGYCDFYSVASKGSIASFVERIKGEIASRATGDKVDTIYFGGGTPSVLSVDQINEILITQTSCFDCSCVSETTLEANPEQLTIDFLENLSSIGFNRLSVGVQSFDDNHLSVMGRRHSADDAVKAIERAGRAGFDNISIDLIYGLPFMSVEQWGRNIDSAIGLGVEHISAYHLTIEPRTAFSKNGMQPVDEQTSERHYFMLCDAMARAGYEHYEISNFARPNRRSKHNSAYWNSTPYLGFGPSAHSYDGGRVRRWNVASVNSYLSEDHYFESEELTLEDIHNEFIMTRLRTLDGFLKSDYERQFNRPFVSVKGVTIDNDRVYIAPSDWLISDAIISSLFI